MATAKETKNKVFIPIKDRPRCQKQGCKHHAQHTGNYRKDGTPLFRKWCPKHHAEISGAKKGLSASEWTNSWHAYRKHRRDFCENRDGRLGFRCRYKIRHLAQLEVDHINGNPKDNRPRNLQTLCGNCHCYKTHMNKDYATPGRKKLKNKGMFTKLLNK